MDSRTDSEGREAKWIRCRTGLKKPYASTIRSLKKKSGKSYEFEAYFEDKKTGKPLRILLYSGWDIDEAEKYIEVIFNLGLWKEYDTGE